MRPSGTRCFLLGAAMILTSCLAAGASADAVRFQQQPAEVGERSELQIEFQLQLQMDIQQAGQQVDTRKQAFFKRQQRELTVTAVQGRLASDAYLAYAISENVISDGSDPPRRVSHPVAGKTYQIRRRSGKLEVFDSQGNPPPDEERLQVEHDMQQFGLPNPLAGYLAGKRVEVGQVLSLPAQLAEQLLGPQDQVGQVTAFELRLERIIPAGETDKQAAGVPLAQFATRIKIRPAHAQEGLDMEVTGTMRIDPRTCRVVLMELTGPVAFEETFGPENGQFSILTAGHMRVHAKVEMR